MIYLLNFLAMTPSSGRCDSNQLSILARCLTAPLNRIFTLDEPTGVLVRSNVLEKDVILQFTEERNSGADEDGTRVTIRR